MRDHDGKSSGFKIVDGKSTDLALGTAKIQLALILGLAFIESLVLFTLVIIFAKVV